MNLHPTICNICGGSVVYTSNAEIYGREYGSGRCYLCRRCGAYVGTHKPRPREALGLLADHEMRELKRLATPFLTHYGKEGPKRTKSETTFIFGCRSNWVSLGRIAISDTLAQVNLKRLIKSYVESRGRKCGMTTMVSFRLNKCRIAAMRSSTNINIGVVNKND